MQFLSKLRILAISDKGGVKDNLTERRYLSQEIKEVGGSYE
jgi:hypothetical protein